MTDFSKRLDKLIQCDLFFNTREYILHDPMERITRIYWRQLFEPNENSFGGYITESDAQHIGFNNYNWNRPFPFKKRH